MLDRRDLLTMSAAAGASSLLVDLARGPDAEIALWPDQPPGGLPAGLSESIVERENPFNLKDRAAHGVIRPILSLFRPKRPNGAALLIAPGGGYSWVVVDKEGFEGARWFNTAGITVYVLRYRLPHQGWAAQSDAPLQDAQRAMRVIRMRAREDRIDPGRVAVMGFSAGGHVAGSLATRFAQPVSPALADEANVSARPNLAALIYPVASMGPFAHPGSRKNLLGAEPDAARVGAYSIENTVSAETPPTLLVHAGDDAVVPVENALLVYDALRRHRVGAAMHLFEKGGHGFGLRGIDGTPLAAWPHVFLDFAKSHGLI